MKYKTEQEEFWAGDFGNEYIGRNQGDKLLAANLEFFAKALRATRGVKSCIEFGANIGMNLRALKLLYPIQEQHAVEINANAARELAKIIPKENVHQNSILEFKTEQSWDLAFVKGVLIHINPDELSNVYDKLVGCCNKYVLVAEYYNPTPASMPYRGFADRLFKRDFAGEIMDRHPQMVLIDYGFAYHRDPIFPQDDINWFLLGRQN